MNDQATSIADVRKGRKEAYIIDHGLPGFVSSLDAECKDGSCATWQITLCQAIRRIIGQPRIMHPADNRMLLQEASDPQRVLAMTLHTQRERLQPLEQEKGIKRTDAG